jgi:hypothetical protein
MRRFVIGFVGISMLMCGAARGAVTFTDIADTNTTAPGQTVKFNQIDVASISGNDLSFLAFYPGGFGKYTSTVSPVANFKLIDTGNTIGTHGAVEGLGNGGVSGSDATVQVIYGTGEGLYHGTVGTAGVSKIIESGTTAPGQTTAFSNFDDVKPSGTHVAFKGFYDNANGSGIYSSTFTGTSLTKIVDQNTTAPGQGAFTSFAAPVINGNNVVFWGQASTDGIYAGTVGTAGSTKIADRTDSPAGRTHFTGFVQTPSVSGSMAAFEGVFSGGAGLYSATIGTAGFVKVAESGDPAPGTGVNFSSVQDPSTNGKNVEFLGDYIVAGSSKTGVFLDTNGTITNIIKAGDALFGSTVSSVGVGNCAYDGFRVSFNYHLANGVSGIAVADLPEPAFFGILILGANCALRRRARR